MILLNSFPLTWQQVRELPKLNHHIREKAMVDFVQQVIRERLGDQDYPDNLINDNFGKVVSNRKINLKNGMNKILFNENLPAGMYVVTFKLESGEFISNKILIKN